MKEYKIFYIKEVETPDVPDVTYRKLYPKADGWYTLDSDGNELKIEGIKIVDEFDNVFPQKAYLKFGWPFTVTEDGDKIKITLFDEDADGTFLFTHGNEYHDPAFATAEDLLAHLEDPNPHGINIDDIHEQNTDQYLDLGGDNQVSAEEIKNLLLTAQTGKSGRFTQAEVLVTRAYTTYLAAALTNHVKFVLPSIAENVGKTFTFRLIEQAEGYAMNVERSEMDVVVFNDLEWEGVTTDVKGTWFTIQNDGEKWYIITDSGLTVANEI